MPMLLEAIGHAKAGRKNVAKSIWEQFPTAFKLRVINLYEATSPGCMTINWALIDSPWGAFILSSKPMRSSLSVTDITEWVPELLL